MSQLEFSCPNCLLASLPALRCPKPQWIPNRRYRMFFQDTEKISQLHLFGAVLFLHLFYTFLYFFYTFLQNIAKYRKIPQVAHQAHQVKYMTISRRCRMFF